MRHLILERTVPRHVIVGALMVAGNSHGLALQLQPMDVGLQGKPQHVNAVTHWNRIATEIFPIEPGPLIDSRAFAILHAAIHDAVNPDKPRTFFIPSFPDYPSLAAVSSAAAAEVLTKLIGDAKESP